MVIPIDYQVRIWPDDALRLRANEVEHFDEEGRAGPLRHLVMNMGEAMYGHGGAGLAAPQVGVLQRVIVLRDEKAVEKGRMAGFGLVNPVIVEHSEEREGGFEGCLSLPGIQLPIERWTTVTVEANDVYGGSFAVAFDGWEARVVQHEIDHLEGKMILDYLPEGESTRLVHQWSMKRRLDAVRPSDYSPVGGRSSIAT